jgi:organic hydroperoxide reductase OsmC/OhrA
LPAPGRQRIMRAVADEKVEIVRSVSSGVVGRARNTTRDAALVLDSSSRPQADAFTNSEAFLAGVSSCGVTLIEMHAQETGVPLARMTATIEGVRVPPEPRFSRVTMRFELVGVTQAQAEELVETYRRR